MPLTMPPVAAGVSDLLADAVLSISCVDLSGGLEEFPIQPLSLNTFVAAQHRLTGRRAHHANGVT
jgi:hypothetical protein